MKVTVLKDHNGSHHVKLSSMDLNWYYFMYIALLLTYYKINVGRLQLSYDVKIQL
jgi:hypothetical protein